MCYKSLYHQQVAQLSQRDRAAGWVSFGHQWKTGRRQYFADIIGLSSNVGKKVHGNNVHGKKTSTEKWSTENRSTRKKRPWNKGPSENEEGGKNVHIRAEKSSTY